MTTIRELIAEWRTEAERREAHAETLSKYAMPSRAATRGRARGLRDCANQLEAVLREHTGSAIDELMALSHADNTEEGK